MLGFALLFAAGIGLFHQLAAIPNVGWLPILLAGTVLLASVKRLRVLIPLLIGVMWSHGFALVNEPPFIDSDAPSQRVEVQGRIVSLPQTAHGGSRFLFETEALTSSREKTMLRHRLRLSWRQPPDLRAGDRWALTAKIKPVHGFASPATWDYEGWLYHQGVRYSGYVIDPESARRLDADSCCLINQLREAVARNVRELDISAFARGVVLALSVAIRADLSESDRNLFRVTGTSHLMAVSGLHIGLIAGSGFLLTGGAWRLFPRLCLRTPARTAGVLGGLAAATIYALLAGMGLPTQRALLALLVIAVGVLLRRDPNPVNVLSLAAIVVLAWHPPSVLSAGFWLSFIAVASILAVQPWLRGRSRLSQAVVLQFAISVALWPVLSAFGLPSSGVAPLVNLLLVPLFGFVIVPWCLGGILLQIADPAIGQHALQPLGDLLDGVRHFLVFADRSAADLPVLATIQPTGIWLLALAVVLLLLPPGVPLRWLAVPATLIALLPREPDLRHGDFAFHLLDVGQGLSAVVETRNHVLVFDTGPRYPSGFTTATAVVTPFLNQRGWRRIDRLVLSHGDVDHAGGAAQLVKLMPTMQVDSGEPTRVKVNATACRAGDRWNWEGVVFEYLYPNPIHAPSEGNNASCVLRITNPAGSVLLTGDIEQRVESELVDRAKASLASRIVVAAHHGSRTSSSPAFIEATSPEYVLYAAGWANRWGFPVSEVSQRWEDAGSKSLNTAHVGTISFVFGADGQMSAPDAWRRDAQRFWWHDSGSAKASHAVSSGD